MPADCAVIVPEMRRESVKGVRTLDSLELERGARVGRPRGKFTELSEMLAALHQRPDRAGARDRVRMAGDLFSILRLHIVFIAVTAAVVFGWLFGGRYLWGVALIGGMAKNIGFVDSLKRNLGVDILVPENPEYVSAIGAAVSD